MSEGAGPNLSPLVPHLVEDVGGRSVHASTKETYVDLIFEWLSDNNSTENFDFTKPYVRRSLRYVYPLFVFLHALVALVGILGNSAILAVVARRRLYHNQTFFLLANLALLDIIKCVFVLPLTLTNLLIQNWTFGSFLCFFMPMLQSFPLHASTLSFLMIAIDRYRLILHPFKSRLPAGLCTIAVWVVAMCVVLPYAVYIKYIDLGSALGDRFQGVGICYVQFEKGIEEYIRAMFVTLYAMPLAIISFLYVRISAELKAHENSAFSIRYASHSAHVLSALADRSYQAGAAWAGTSGSPPALPDSPEDREAHPESSRAKNYGEGATRDSDDDLDLAKEKRTQNYLITMTTLFAICWCPLQILLLVTYFVHENHDNQAQYDVTYLTFTWFGFLSVCTNPVLFASWRMSSATKDRLRGYFRFSNRRGAGEGAGRRFQTQYVNGSTQSTLEDTTGELTEGESV